MVLLTGERVQLLTGIHVPHKLGNLNAILESQIRVPISRINLETCKLEITQTGWGLRVMLEFKEGADRKPCVLNTHLSTQNYDSSVCCHHQKPVIWMKYMQEAVLVKRIFNSIFTIRY